MVASIESLTLRLKIAQSLTENGLRAQTPQNMSPYTLNPKPETPKPLNPKPLTP